MNPPGERPAARREKVQFILPPELWTEIFLRLPVRTLLSLKSLRKTFSSIIETPKFARDHFKLFNNKFHGENGTRLIVIDRPVEVGVLKGAQCVTLNGDQLIETAKFKMPMDWSYTIEVMGCVDGLLLLHKFKSPLEKWDSTEMILWNPLLGKALIILPSPKSLLQVGRRGSWADLCLGYDPVTDDYKALAAVQSEDKDTIWIDIYSVKRGSWKASETKSLIRPVTMCLSNMLYLDGAIYWIGGFVNQARELHKFDGIVLFDLSIDHFWFAVLPSTELKISLEEKRVRILVVVDGSVAVFSISPNHTWVWVLNVNDGNWTGAFEWDSKQEWFNFLIARRVNNAIFFEESSELLISLHGQGVVSYSYKTHEIKSHNHGATYVGTFVESLLWRELLPQPNPDAEAAE